MEANEIGTVELSASSRLAFSVSSWKGRRYANIRKFVSTSKYSGPTKAGMQLGPDLLLSVIDVLVKLSNELASPQNKEIARVKKNNDVDIIISTVEPDELNALPGVDIREFVDSVNYAGPTKKGIRFPWEKLSEVLTLLKMLAEKLNDIDSDQKTLFPSIKPEWKEKAEAISSNKPRERSGVLKEILPDGPKSFPHDFVENGHCDGKKIQMPPEPLEMKQLPDGNFIVCTQFDFSLPVRNEAEGNFILYSHLRGNREITIPFKMIVLFKAVKAYENYVRKLGQSLITAFERKSGYKPMAVHQVKEVFRSLGLPWLE